MPLELYIGLFVVGTTLLLSRRKVREFVNVKDLVLMVLLPVGGFVWLLLLIPANCSLNMQWDQFSKEMPKEAIYAVGDKVRYVPTEYELKMADSQGTKVSKTTGTISEIKCSNFKFRWLVWLPLVPSSFEYKVVWDGVAGPNSDDPLLAALEKVRQQVSGEEWFNNSALHRIAKVEIPVFRGQIVEQK